MARALGAPFVRLLAVLSLAVGGLSLTTPAQADYLYVAPLTASAFTVSPGAGEVAGDRVHLTSTGVAATFVTTSGTTHRMEFAASADLCDGAPVLQAAVDGVTLTSREVWGFGNYSVAGSWPPGRHKVVFRYLNDHRTAACDRNLRVRPLRLMALADGRPYPSDTFQAAHLQDVRLSPSTAASAGPELVRVSADATLTLHLDSQGLGGSLLGVVVQAQSCGGTRARLTLVVDGVTAWSGEAPMPAFGSYIDYDEPANGTHLIALSVADVGAAGGCVRTVDVTDVRFLGRV